MPPTHLAGYDASGTFNTAIHSLSGDAKALATMVGKPLPQPPELAPGIKTVGGLVIGQVQAHDVKAASQTIEAILKQVIALLRAPGTRDKLAPVQAEVEGPILQAAATLYLGGVVSYQPILDDLGAPWGSNRPPRRTLRSRPIRGCARG